MVKKYIKSAKSEIPNFIESQFQTEIILPVSNEKPIVLYIHDFGSRINDEDTQDIANKLNRTHGVGVLLVDYSTSPIKYSPDLLEKLQDRLPSFLVEIKEFMSQEIRTFIEEGQYQEAVNALFFTFNQIYPLNDQTVIPIYGGEGLSFDGGLLDAMDIINTMISYKEDYPNLNWSDCIAFGQGYGGYLIELVEKIVPGLFSMLINLNGLVMPSKKSLFANLTEWRYGQLNECYVNKIGRFPIHLVDHSGWTTNKSHDNYFAPHHFDIRNLNNSESIKSAFAKKTTPRFYIDLYSNDSTMLKFKRAYIENLVSENFSIDYHLIEQGEKVVYIKETLEGISVDLSALFSYYYESFSNRSTNNKIGTYSWYAVYGGAYLFYFEENRINHLYISSDNSSVYASDFVQKYMLWDKKLSENIINAKKVKDTFYLSLLD